MAICYDKLWKLLIDKKMNRTELKEALVLMYWLDWEKMKLFLSSQLKRFALH